MTDANTGDVMTVLRLATLSFCLLVWSTGSSLASAEPVSAPASTSDGSWVKLHFSLNDETGQRLSGPEIEALLCEPSVQHFFAKCKTLMLRDLPRETEGGSLIEDTLWQTALESLMSSEIDIRAKMQANTNGNPSLVVQGVLGGRRVVILSDLIQRMSRQESRVDRCSQQTGWKVNGYLLDGETKLYVASSPNAVCFSVGPISSVQPKFNSLPSWRLPRQQGRVVGVQIDAKNILTAVSSLLKAEDPKELDDFRRTTEALGIDRWLRVDAAIHVRRNAVVCTGGILTDGKPGALLGLFHASPQRPPHVRTFVPSGPLSLTEFNLAPKDLLNRYRGLLQEVQPSSFRFVDKLIHDINLQFGIDIDRDIISNLGQPLTVSVSEGSNPGLLVLKYAAPIGRAAQFTAAVDAMTTRSHDALDSSIQITKSQTGNGNAWNIRPKHPGAEGLQDCWLVTSGPAAYCSLLIALPASTAPDWESSEKRILPFPLPPTDVSIQWFSDMSLAWRLLHAQIKPECPPGVDATAISQSDLPDVDAVARHLGVSSGWFNVVDEGAYWECVMEFGKPPPVKEPRSTVELVTRIAHGDKAGVLNRPSSSKNVLIAVLGIVLGVVVTGGVIAMAVYLNRTATR